MTVSGSSNNIPSKINGVSEVRTPASTSCASSCSKGGSSSVEVSTSAKEMSELSKLVQDSPDVRTDVVESFKSRIASGDYKVDLDQLADKLSDVI
ncbi:MAG: flagellar biosynthesis anti-sigma factor FlgM [Vulcanimicrobiota bacterium]